MPIDQKELIQDRKSEIEADKQRKVRQDVVARYWGSEDELTKQAYATIGEDKGSELVKVDLGDGEPEEFKGGLKQMKEEIIKLKLSMADPDRLRKLLGAFTNLITGVKEAMVMEKMNEMKLAAMKQQEKESKSVNADVVKEIKSDDSDVVDDMEIVG